MKKSSAPKIVLAITSYHLDVEMAEMTQACLDSLKYGRPDEVLLIDDHSPYVAGFTGYTLHIYRESNGGFPKCANTGFQAAYERGADIIVLSNNDVTYTPGWLEGLLKPLETGYDISSVRVSDSDGYTTEDRIEADGTFGSLWAMKRVVYETIGGFDERFEKGTFEDKDFAVRAKAAGFRIGKNHAALVEHVGRATMDKLYPGREDFTENRERFIDKHGRIV